MTVTPSVEDSDAVDKLASVLEALLAVLLLGIISRKVTVTLPAVKVTTASIASGNWLRRLVIKVVASKELTSPATVSCIVTTDE